MLSTMANSTSDSIMDRKIEPPDLDYEGPSHHAANGSESIPELVANSSPTRNRRKRRKGIPTRVAPTVIHKDNDSSDDDSLPPFLMPHSPASMAMRDTHNEVGNGTMATSLHNAMSLSNSATPPLSSGTPPPSLLVKAKDLRGSAASPISYSPSTSSPKSKPIPRRRSSTTRSKTKTLPDIEVPNPDVDVSGMVFGYTKVTSSITTTSRGAKRVKIIVYMCNFCNFKTTDNTAFWEHSVQHLFTCPHCPFKAFTRQSLVSHMEKEHPGQVPEEYINICEISVIDMRVTRNITSDPPPLGKGMRLDYTSQSEDGGGETPPPRLLNQKHHKNKATPDLQIPPTAHGGIGNKQVPTDLKFRCEFCPYITSIFSAFMNHQKEHNTEVEKKTKGSPAPSGKLKSLLVGRSLTPPPTANNKRDVSPGAKVHQNTTSTAQTKGGKAKVMTTPVLKVPQVHSKSTALANAANAVNVANTANAANTDTHLGPTPTLTLPHDSGISADSLLQSELSKHAKCPICNFVLRSLSELEAHIHLCHQSRLTVTAGTSLGSPGDSCGAGNQDDVAGDYTWCCIYCTSRSDTKMGVVTHIKNQHPGEKIRVWRWANKPNNAALSPTDETNQMPPTETLPPSSTPTTKKKSKKSKKNASKNAEKEDPNSLILKQIVSSTIDNVYGAAFGDVQSAPLSLTKPVLASNTPAGQSLLKIPDVTNTSDIMEGKCAITVRKVTSGTQQARPMRSLITGGLVTSPGKPISSQITTLTTASPPIRSKNSDSDRSKEKMPDLCLQPPLLTATYLGMTTDLNNDQDGLMDLSIKKPNRQIDNDNKSDIKSEPMSPGSDVSNEMDFKSLFVKDQEELGVDLNNLDVDVEVRKESLIPTDHIRYDEEERLHCCRHCSYQSRSYGHIVDHISTHTGMKTWSCSYCSYRSNRRHDLLRHLGKSHPGSKLKMIRNVPYSSKFSHPLKMGQRVAHARGMVAKKRTSKISKNVLKKGLKPGASIRGTSPTKTQKSPSKSWQPPPTVEFWECPICTRRGLMDIMEKHIPTVHPEKVRKRISKKEILEPSIENLIMSATFTEQRKLRVNMVKLEQMVVANQDMGNLPLLNKLPEKLTQMPDILQKYMKGGESVDDTLLGKELEEQQQIELKDELEWLSSLDSCSTHSDDQLSSSTPRQYIKDEEYRCQYCVFTDKSLYVIRTHLIWSHPDMLLKCVDMRAKPPLTPRVVHMCHACTFHSVSPYSLLSHYSRNPKHNPTHDDSDSDSSDSEDLPTLERGRARSASTDNDETLPALEKTDHEKKTSPGGKFLSRPLNSAINNNINKPKSRNVALKRVTKSCKNTLKFMQGTQLQCRYCKDFKIYDSTIMKDHLLTEHCGQPAIAIDVRSRELRRTSRVFFCPILECNFTEYGPEALVKHLNKAHPDTAFDALIIQICPKEKNSAASSVTTTPVPAPAPSINKPETPVQQKTSVQQRTQVQQRSLVQQRTPVQQRHQDTKPSNNNNVVPTTPVASPEPPKPPKTPTSAKKETKGSSKKKGKDKKKAQLPPPSGPEKEEDGILRGGTMPKISADLTMEKRYWCAYCDAHSGSIEKVKAHFLDNHMDQKAQLIDARARVLRKKSRLFFCWNVTCSFTTFLENQATLHEQSQACLANFAPDEYSSENNSGKVDSSGFSSPAHTPEHSAASGEPASSSGSGGSRMFQCLYCSLMTSSRINMLSHMAAEHACTSGGYSEISTEFNKDGDIIMNVGGHDGDS